MLRSLGGQKRCKHASPKIDSIVIKSFDKIFKERKPLNLQK